MSRSFRFLGFLLVLAGFLYAGAVSSKLPDRVPSHWDAAGRVNGTMPKPWGVFIVPLVMALLWLLFMALPRLSPRGFEMESFSRSWGILTAAVLAFMLYIEILTLNAAVSGGRLSPRPIFGGIGVLFIVIGSVLKNVKRNFFAGIRTPWTLASEEVWDQTHKMAAGLFLAAGLFVIGAAMLGLGWWVMIAALALAGLIPVVASYIFYRRLYPRT